MRTRLAGIAIALAALLVWAAVVDGAGLYSGRGKALLATNGSGLVGVNLSGPEFAPWNGQTFPSTANWNDLKSKGITRVRLPIAWESIQPTLNAALDATYLASLRSALAAAASRGIKVLVDLHNFGRYCDQAHWVSSGCGYAGNSGSAGTGVSVLGDATLTSAAFVDLWTRLATALAGNPGVLGYGLMNEPAPGIVGTNLLTTPNYFTGADWFGLNAPAATQLAAGTNPIAGYGPAWTITSGSGFASVAQAFTFANVAYDLSVYASVTAGTETMFLQIAAASANKTVTTTPTRFDFTSTPAAGASSIQIGVANGSAGHTIRLSNSALGLGSSPATYQPSPWMPFAQAAITAIRLVDTATPIYVGGFNFSNAAIWVQNNYELSLLTGGNLIFEAHCYPDTSQGNCGPGIFSGTFTSYSIDTASGRQALAGWLAWLSSQGVRGHLGEYGVPNNATDANPQWLVLQANTLSLLAQNKVSSTMWFYNANGVQSGNVLGVAPVSGVSDPRLLNMLRFNYLMRRDLGHDNDNAPVGVSLAA